MLLAERAVRAVLATILKHEGLVDAARQFASSEDTRLPPSKLLQLAYVCACDVHAHEYILVCVNTVCICVFLCASICACACACSCVYACSYSYEVLYLFVCFFF